MKMHATSPNPVDITTHLAVTLAKDKQNVKTRRQDHMLTIQFYPSPRPNPLIVFRLSSSPKAENITKILEAAKIEGVEGYLPGLFAKAVGTTDVNALLANVGAGGGGGGGGGGGAAAAATAVAMAVNQSACLAAQHWHALFPCLPCPACFSIERVLCRTFSTVYHTPVQREHVSPWTFISFSP